MKKTSGTSTDPEAKINIFDIVSLHSEIRQSISLTPQTVRCVKLKRLFENKKCNFVSE